MRVTTEYTEFFLNHKEKESNRREHGGDTKCTKVVAERG
ncbi:hypothetical protein SAMN05421640_2782 [Ekhidna lutea]|uniref:Uncharacterized protein n=1 Tax=Ekhidna lutea TaxID=447679 RepID=A0A239KP59_EKHLU|nr:hypothetical protein SAMN05421640_2782 [Ekhidna lutea]